MDSTRDQYKVLLQAILPADLFDYFEIVQVIVNEKTIDVHLDELNNLPEGYQSEKLISKGFHPAVVIQDFPIRERALFLHVRRRKWQVESSGKIISREWDITAKGARYTKGFAAFLKELFGQIPGEQQKS
jgi:hypothetical protein